MADRTPLYERHLALGARMFEFGGWEMPLWYGSINGEHLAVRSGVGLFDVSHMGKLLVSGESGTAELQRLVTRELSRHPLGRAVYAHMLEDDGAIIDDMIITRVSSDRLLVVCNAARRAAVRDRLKAGLRDAELADLTHDYCCLAVQGPMAKDLLRPVAEGRVLEIGRYHALMSSLDLREETGTERPEEGRERAGGVLVSDTGEGIPALISRTGYTGEDGYELFAHWRHAGTIWDGLLEAGADKPLSPIGLGARDTLRLEKCYLLSGHDFDGSQTTLEADAEFAVDWGHDFVGKGKLGEQKRTGDYPRLCAILSIGRGIPREGYPLLSSGGERIGRITSGTLSPTLNVGIALGYLPAESSMPGTDVIYQVGSRRVAAKVMRKPFLSR